MTEHQHALAQALARCTFSPGTTAKRFVRWASSQPIERELSDKAAAFLERLGHSYRRQLGRCMAENCETCRWLSREQREQVVELLRCAAELDGLGIRPPLTVAIRRLGVSKHIGQVADWAACAAMEDFDAAGLPYDWFAWLEAARRVEERSWP